MNYYWLFVIPVILYFAGGIIFCHRIRARRFVSREDIPFDIIYERYFKEKNIPREKVEELWFEAAKAFELPANKLRPEDSFEKELSYCLNWYPFMDLNDEFNCVAYNRIKENKIDKYKAENIKTFGDYINLFAEPDGTIKQKNKTSEE